ncbi:leucine zipper domain-containing protein [Micrococcus lylae]|uniref:leucine zipper domain-containing protein n=1 Tax=Micrococcus lylae TaxID=1273 RepID=UPI0025434165|nr:leucine zipper domain-containing protein [Micrococcus lylae]WIK81584.1 leucine zipper domain-containing protein [Micrococcus lylae]
MSHANARLTVYGRTLLVHRVLEEGMPVAHAAALMGISRQCAHRWVSRYRTEGEHGLQDRSSRPHHCPSRTSAQTEQQVLQARSTHRRGQDWISTRVGVPARTVNRILARHLNRPGFVRGSQVPPRQAPARGSHDGRRPRTRPEGPARSRRAHDDG